MSAGSKALLFTALLSFVIAVNVFSATSEEDRPSAVHPPIAIVSMLDGQQYVDHPAPDDEIGFYFSGLSYETSRGGRAFLEHGEIMKNLRAIHLLSRNVRYTEPSPGKMLIETQDGISREVENAYFYSEGVRQAAIHYKYEDPLHDDMVSVELPLHEMASMEFASSTPNVSSSGRLFPPHYRFDPFTGEALQQPTTVEKQ